jgi:hypothetical protein
MHMSNKQPHFFGLREQSGLGSVPHNKVYMFNRYPYLCGAVFSLDCDQAVMKAYTSKRKVVDYCPACSSLKLFSWRHYAKSIDIYRSGRSGCRPAVAVAGQITHREASGRYRDQQTQPQDLFSHYHNGAYQFAAFTYFLDSAKVKAGAGRGLSTDPYCWLNPIPVDNKPLIRYLVELSGRRFAGKKN